MKPKSALVTMSISRASWLSLIYFHQHLMNMNHPTLRNNTDRQRYELLDEGQVVAFAQYKPAGDDAIMLIHTEVGAEHGGKGYGSALARQALDDVRNQHKKVIPVCEFIAGYVSKHREYDDLVIPAG
jgi:uncharacterized protein